jgi:hypothetical protein
MVNDAARQRTGQDHARPESPHAARVPAAVPRKVRESRQNEGRSTRSGSPAIRLGRLARSLRAIAEARVVVRLAS